VAGLSYAPSEADPCRVGLGSLNFALSWYVTLAVLGVATWFAARARVHITFERVSLVFLVGIAAGWSCTSSLMASPASTRPQDLQLRFFCALGISWLVAICALPAGSGPAGYSTLALAGLAGVNAPPLAFVASSFMVCGGGHPSCAF
jgi:hypothetical protein